jgi:sulfatase maturation enzyme AslB (radical SAM superfamily)
MAKDTNVWCAMIHGGLNLDFKKAVTQVGHCCLRPTHWALDRHDTWNHPALGTLRKLNLTNQWDQNCGNCESLEKAGLVSFRQGMNQGLRVDSRGPARLDLMFDISCNLACRTCGTHSSTYWQKHLKQHGLWPQSIFSPKKSQEVIEVLSTLDLTNLQQLVFCGGETLLGTSYWNIVEWLAKHVPTAKQHLTLCFQTNGTQPIPPQYHDLIEKFHLVRLHVSLDGVKEKFEYLRWPASWNQVTENILHLKETAPSNVMFLIEETVSIFNLCYGDALDAWVKQNFANNREGDPVDHTKHLASGVFSLANCSAEYVTAMAGKPQRQLIPSNWNEKPALIQNMIKEIKKADQLRGQCFEKTFPELAEFYQRFL